MNNITDEQLEAFNDWQDEVEETKPKRVINYEAHCDNCDRSTWFEEDLDQKPQHVGGYDMIWADCGSCGFGVQFYGSNAD